MLATTGCRYDPDNFSFGGEDWDVWMCMAENGYWGGTLPEFLYWCVPVEFLLLPE